MGPVWWVSGFRNRREAYLRGYIDATTRIAVSHNQVLSNHCLVPLFTFAATSSPFDSVLPIGLIRCSGYVGMPLSRRPTKNLFPSTSSDGDDRNSKDRAPLST